MADLEDKLPHAVAMDVILAAFRLQQNEADSQSVLPDGSITDVISVSRLYSIAQECGIEPRYVEQALRVQTYAQSLEANPLPKLLLETMPPQYESDLLSALRTAYPRDSFMATRGSRLTFQNNTLIFYATKTEPQNNWLLRLISKEHTVHTKLAEIDFYPRYEQLAVYMDFFDPRFVQATSAELATLRQRFAKYASVIYGTPMTHYPVK